MTEITKHYHGFEVTIEPVDGSGLTEDDYRQIEENAWGVLDATKQWRCYLKSTGHFNTLGYCIFDEDILLAKIEAKRMPEKEEEPMTVGVLSEILERLDALEKQIRCQHFFLKSQDGQIKCHGCGMKEMVIASMQHE